MYTLNDVDSRKDVLLRVSMTKNNVWRSKPPKSKYRGAGIGVLSQIAKFSNGHISENSSAIEMKF